MITIVGQASSQTQNKFEPPRTSHTRPITEFLEAIRTNGGAIGCNIDRIDSSLAVKIELLKTNNASGIYRAEYRMMPTTDSHITSGEYSQFQSSAASFCQISFSIKNRAFCNIQSDAYRSAVGERPVPYSPPHPAKNQSPDKSYFHLVGNLADTNNQIWLSIRHGEECVYRLVVRTIGSFKEIQ